MVDPSKNVLTPAQQKRAAAALGAAFFQDPFVTYVFPDATTRIQNTSQLLLPVVRCGLRYGGVEVTPQGDGALVWISGDQMPLSLWQLVRSGMIWTPMLSGLGAFRRVQSHDGACEHILKEFAPQGFAYIYLVGVTPESAGQGLGKQLIQSAMSTMGQQGYSTCLLRTDNPNNVPLYRHLGFEQIHTDTMATSGLQYWFLSQAL